MQSAGNVLNVLKVFQRLTPKPPFTYEETYLQDIRTQSWMEYVLGNTLLP
jgi:hypothetical protein